MGNSKKKPHELTLVYSLIPKNIQTEIIDIDDFSSEIQQANDLSQKKMIEKFYNKKILDNPQNKFGSPTNIQDLGGFLSCDMNSVSDFYLGCKYQMVLKRDLISNEDCYIRTSNCLMYL